MKSAVTESRAAMLRTSFTIFVIVLILTKSGLCYERDIGVPLTPDHHQTMHRWFVIYA